MSLLLLLVGASSGGPGPALPGNAGSANILGTTAENAIIKFASGDSATISPNAGDSATIGGDQ